MNFFPGHSSTAAKSAGPTVIAAIVTLVLSGCTPGRLGGPNWTDRTTGGADEGRFGWTHRTAHADPTAEPERGITPAYVWSGSICYVPAPALPESVRPRRILKRPERITIVPADEAGDATGVQLPDGQFEVVIPAEYIWIEPEEPDSTMTDWLPAVCADAVDASLTLRVQRRLAEYGFYDGPVDGISGPLTRSAVEAYKRSNDLHGDGLTLETLRHLGISTSADASSIVSLPLPAETGGPIG
jgi:hypothetical protein